MTSPTVMLSTSHDSSLFNTRFDVVVGVVVVGWGGCVVLWSLLVLPHCLRGVVVIGVAVGVDDGVFTHLQKHVAVKVRPQRPALTQLFYGTISEVGCQWGGRTAQTPFPP
jgi:hypothetical protein